MLNVRPAVWVRPGGPGAGCVRRALVPRSAYIFGVQPNGMEVDPHLGFQGSPGRQCFSSGGQAECCIVVLESQTGGLVGQ